METNEFLQCVIDTTREPFLVLDLSQRVISANRAFYQTFKVNDNETVGQRLSDLGNGQWNIPALHTLLETIIPNDTIVTDFSVSHNFPDLGQKTMLLNARKVFRPGNHTELLILAIDDITEKLKAAETLRGVNERNSLIVEGARDFGIIMTDPAGIIISWNPGAERITGFGEKHIIGKSISIFFTPEDREDGVPEREIGTALSNGSAEDERWHLKRGGERFFASGMVRPLYDENDKLKGFAKVFRDATDRKKAEEALAETNVLLKDSNERLKMSMTETHHRIKNTLNMLSAMLFLQSRKGDTVPSAELSKINASIQGFATMHDALTIKINSDQDGAVINAKDIVEKLLSIMRLSDDRIIIESNIESVELPIKMCSSLSVIINELVTNAHKHGANKINVELLKTDTGYYFSVSDNGPGFPEGFDPNKTNRVGLSVINKLARIDLGNPLLFENTKEGACVRSEFRLL